MCVNQFWERLNVHFIRTVLLRICNRRDKYIIWRFEQCIFRLNFYFCYYCRRDEFTRIVSLCRIHFSIFLFYFFYNTVFLASFNTPWKLKSISTVCACVQQQRQQQQCIGEHYTIYDATMTTVTTTSMDVIAVGQYLLDEWLAQ